MYRIGSQHALEDSLDEEPLDIFAAHVDGINGLHEYAVSLKKETERLERKLRGETLSNQTKAQLIQQLRRDIES